jgi:hypothetical protein
MGGRLRETLLGSGDIQSLADFGASFGSCGHENVSDRQAHTCWPGSAAALPMAPLILGLADQLIGAVWKLLA